MTPAFVNGRAFGSVLLRPGRRATCALLPLPSSEAPLKNPSLVREALSKPTRVDRKIEAPFETGDAIMTKFTGVFKPSEQPVPGSLAYLGYWCAVLETAITRSEILISEDRGCAIDAYGTLMRAWHVTEFDASTAVDALGSQPLVDEYGYLEAVFSENQKIWSVFGEAAAFQAAVSDMFEQAREQLTNFYAGVLKVKETSQR
jgi:hypothetical protein